MNSRITGDLAISDFATPATRFTVNVDSIDADRYLAPPVEATAANTNADSPLPIEDLKLLNVQGALTIDALTLSGLDLRDIAIELNAAAGNIALNPIRASLYDGTFAGNMRLSVTGAEPTATVNTTLSAINLEPLLRDFTEATSAYLTGVANIELALSGSGADTTTIKRNLNGGGSNDLLIRAPGWQVNGNGTLVDLGNDSIDFDLLASVEASTATTAAEEFDLGGYTLPIACTGNLASPRCLPDAQQIITAAVGNAVQRRLGDFLQDRLGGTQPPAPTDPAAPLSEDAPEDEAPAEETPPEQEPVEELFNRALDRLLR